jgi:ATP/maltotriose-dependent transcriptional regulator MalT
VIEMEILWRISSDNTDPGHAAKRARRHTKSTIDVRRRSRAAGCDPTRSVAGCHGFADELWTSNALQLLSTYLDGPGIARHLVVSLNTVRTHTKSIYAKLGVNSRRAAVRRAEELGLLSRSANH